MKTQVIISCALIFTLSALAEDYRTFTDKAGRTIKAKIIKLDPINKKVTIERDNKKKVTVPITIFSEADQDYILSWSPSEIAKVELPKTQTKLSSDLIKQLADNYEELLPNTYTFFHKDYFHRLTIQHLINSSQPKLKTGPYFDYGFKITMSLSWTPFEDANSRVKGSFIGWGLVSPDGKLKYDTFQQPHPVEIACTTLFRMATNFQSRRNVDLNQFISTMKKCGVPLFGLTASSGREEQREIVPERIDWLLDNGTNYDTAEPHVLYPRKAFSEVQKHLKSAKRMIQ